MDVKSRLTAQGARLKKERANALLEFAFVLPVLLLLIIGTVELSILFYDKAVITNASREGARYGIALRTPSYPTASQIIAYTQSYCQNHLITFSTTPTDVNVTVTASSPSPKFGDTLTVVVRYTYTDLVLHNFINHGNQYTLTATSVMTYE